MNSGAVVLSRSGPAVSADFSNATGAPIVGDSDSGILYWFANGVPIPLGPPSVTGYGAGTGQTAVENTLAFNRALAAHSVVFVPGEISDVYDLNALDPWTSPKIFYGAPTLRFNTISNCIVLQPAISQQSQKSTIQGLGFDNVTNVPASFIKIDHALNTALEKLRFCDTAATYGVDNVNGYGTKIADTVFSDFTGNAVRLRDDGGSTKYSYAFKIDDTDFTRVSGNAIECEGTSVLGITNTIIESCGGKGLVTATAGGPSIQSWNITLNSVYFEANIGIDIDLGTDGAAYWSQATLIGCAFVSSPTIALGAKSKIAIIGCHNSGGNVCTVTGSANAEAFLANSYNFVQSGSFNWTDASAIGAPTTYVPVWSSSGGANTLGNGTITGSYTRIGKLVHYRISFTFGSTSSVTAGTQRLSLPFTADNSVQSEFAGGRITDAGTAVYFPAPIITPNAAFITLGYLDAAAVVQDMTATAPMTWADQDNVSLSGTYLTT